MPIKWMASSAFKILSLLRAFLGVRFLSLQAGECVRVGRHAFLGAVVIRASVWAASQ
jgi:hypothetical protein